MASIASAADVGPSARRRIARHLLPFLFLLYIANFIDRVNVAYAGLEMTRDLRFSDAVFGFGSGVFFVGYMLFQVPGAVLVERWSARRLIAPMLVLWGTTTIVTGFIHTAHEFYAVRILLGIVEAGFFPGVIVYLTHWFRAEDRATAIALFMAAIPTASLIGSPVAGLILGVHWLGLPGWRWLFILEGIPAIGLGFATLFCLTDWPHQARWLSKAESGWITGELQRERLAHPIQRPSLLRVLQQRDIVLLVVLWFFSLVTGYSFTIWLPTILKRGSGLSSTTVGWVAALPYLAGLCAMVWNGRHSDRIRERRWHTAAPLLIGGLGFLLMRYTTGLGMMIAVLTVIGACVYAYLPTFWALPTQLVSESAAAVLVGFINCVGNLGGLAGPYGFGYLGTRTGSYVTGYGYLSLCWLIAGSMVLFLRVGARRSAHAYRSESLAA